jgi:hypothetical protein
MTEFEEKLEEMFQRMHDPIVMVEALELCREYDEPMPWWLVYLLVEHLKDIAESQKDAARASKGSQAMPNNINSEIDTSTPELECEARLMQAYLLHVSTGGRPRAFVAKALDMAQHIEGVLAGCKDDRPRCGAAEK